MADVILEVKKLRDEGLTDSLIMEELTKQGVPPDQVNMAISNSDQGGGMPGDMSMAGPPGGMPAAPMGMPLSSMPPASAISPVPVSAEEGNIYERIEEITEGIVDEKWDELIAEVKKIVEWKGKIEEKQTKIISDLSKLKEDFSTLHQGVLGKLGDYDSRMRDVDTELKAVGKVFKDVIPLFVENVKELSDITGKIKK